MGGYGSAKHYITPPPYYLGRWVVAKAEAPEESIQDMIDKITDATATKRYKVEVMPGIYSEQITMKQYVDLVAPYGYVEIRYNDGVAVTMASDSMIQGFRINMPATTVASTGIAVGAATGVIIEDCWITGNNGSGADIGISVSTGNPRVRRCRIDTLQTGLKQTGAGTTTFVDNTVTAAGVDVDGDAGTLNLYRNELLCATDNVNVAAGCTVNSFRNQLQTRWTIANSATAIVRSHNDVFAAVSRGAAGVMTATEEPQTYLVHNGMSIQQALNAANALTPTDTYRFVVKVFSGEFSEAVTMYQYIDLIGESAQSVVISQAAATVLTCAANSRVKSVRVELTAGTGQAAVLASNVVTTLEDVKVEVTNSAGTNVGLRTSGTGGVTAYDIDVAANHASDYCCQFGGSGATIAYDSYFQNGAGKDIDVQAGATVNTFDCKLRGTGWNIANDATAIVRSHTDHFTAAVTKGAAGIMTCQEKPNVWRVYSGMEIMDAHAAASAGDVIEVAPGTYIEALNITTVVTLVSLAGAERTTITQVDANVVTMGAAATIDGFTIHISNPTVVRTGVVCGANSPTVRRCVFTQLVTAGYGVTVSTGSPVVEECTFSSGLDTAVYQTGAGGTRVRDCTIQSGATHGISAEGGTVYVTRTEVEVAGNGLNANGGTIQATNSAITGTVVDCNVSATGTILVEDCAYNDVTNLGTFVDLTGCREYGCAAGVAVGEWVYASAADTVAEAQANALATMPTIGVVVYKPAADRCKVKNYGYYYDSAAPWTAGQEYWVSAAVAGAITTTMPGVWPQFVGVAVATNRFKILIGPNLGLVHCNEYDAIPETAMQGAQLNDGGVWTDETAAANDAVANDMTLMPAVPAGDDAYYFGAVYPFGELNLQIGTAGVKAPGDWTVNWEYWNGAAWAALAGVTDGTSEFTAAPGAHVVSFTIPADWAASTLNAITAYWIRARLSGVTAPIGAQPLGTQCWTNSIGVGQWVYITTTNDHVGLAQANAAATMVAIGVVVDQIDTDTVLVKLRGKVPLSDAGAAWVASDDVYVSDTAPGAITRVMPVGGIIQKVAEVKSYSDPNLILELAD